jgi:hypothetical protein
MTGQRARRTATGRVSISTGAIRAISGSVSSEPAQRPADDRPLVPSALDDAVTRRPHAVTDACGGRGAHGVFAGAGLAVQVVSAGQAEFDFGMVTEADDLAANEPVATAPARGSAVELAYRRICHHR